MFTFLSLYSEKHRQCLFLDCSCSGSRKSLVLRLSMLEQSSGHQWSPTRPCDLRTWRWACVLVVYPLQHFSASMYHYNKSRFLRTWRACCVICLCHVTNGWTTDTSGDFVWLPSIFFWRFDGWRSPPVMLWECYCPNWILNSLGWQLSSRWFLLFTGCELLLSRPYANLDSECFTGNKISAIIIIALTELWTVWGDNCHQDFCFLPDVSFYAPRPYTNLDCEFYGY